MNEEKSSQESASRFLCFSLGKEKFAMPLLQVKEVIANTETTSYTISKGGATQFHVWEPLWMWSV